MDRLSSDDRIMLWPDARWPQDVGALVLLDGAPLRGADGAVRVDVLRELVAARAPRVPRLQQRLLVPHRGLGPPLWVDCEPASEDHVRLVRVEPPGDERALLRTVEAVRRQRLDRTRPLWDVAVLDGLAEGRVGLVVRLHHVLADGVSAVATLGTILADGAEQDVVPPRAPQPVPTTGQLARDAMARRAGAARRSLARLYRGDAFAHARAVVPLLWTLARLPRAVPTSLHRTVGPSRRFAFLTADLVGIQALARRSGATVNDVLLSAVAAGLGAVLASRGERVDGRTVPVYVPMTLRPALARATARGNNIAQMVVPLPVGAMVPTTRLARVASATRERKSAEHPPVGTVLRTPVSRALLLALLERHPVDVTTADLVGPRDELSVAGARVLDLFPLLPLVGSVALGVGAVSYAGRLEITLVGDADAYPDLDVVVRAVRAELDSLSPAPP